MRRFWNKQTSEAPMWTTPPPCGPVRFDPSVRTAAELVGAGDPQTVPDVTHAAA